MRLSNSLLFLSLYLPIRTSKAADRADNVTHDESWSFLVMADIHTFTPFSFNPDTTKLGTVWKESIKILKSVKKEYGGELVMMPGDSNSYGPLTNQQIVERLGISGYTTEQSIYEAGLNCYKAVRQLFRKAGYGTLLATVGDHELGGNEGFVISGGRSKLPTVPAYRKAFGRGYNKYAGGGYRYNEPIGKIKLRPLGTTYEDTSFAYRHNNALFVTVDAFKLMDDGNSNYIDRTKGFGGEGAITCDVSGDHLDWFESVLVEARNDTSIKHIFVQAHLPIIQPVRKVSCSGQFMDGADQSQFWVIMDKYDVDIYFAGEVHSNTASKSNDPASNLVQIVSGHKDFSNFLVINMTDDVIDVKLFNEVGNKKVWNGQYVANGHLTIDKSSSAGIDISSSGELRLIDTVSALIKFDFQEMLPLGSRQVSALQAH